MIDLEERIRRAAELLDDESLSVRSPLTMSRPAASLAGRRRVPVAQVAAACMLVVGLVGVFWVTARDFATAPATSTSPVAGAGPPTTAVEATAPMTTVAAATPSVPSSVEQWVPPSVTLPVFADVSSVVPPTALGTGPTDWYRLQPDLDVAWYSEGGETSMLCFRTPAGQECQLDELGPTAIGGGRIGVYSLSEQLLVVTLDTDVSVVVSFDNGQTINAQVERDAQTGWGVARMGTTAGATPLDLAMVFAMQPASSVPATIAPVVTTAPSTNG